MNDTNDTNDSNDDARSGDDRIRRALDVAANELSIDPASTSEVAGRVTQRRRRRRAALGLVAAGAVGTVGAIAVTQDRGGDSLELTSPTDTTEAGTSDTAAGGGDGSGDAAATASTVVITTPPTLPPVDAGTAHDVATDAVEVATSSVAPGAQLLPWRDGFLRIGVEYAAQPLPAELPPEIRDLFPPEVLELFPDGLPPTLAEATDVLNEAGLLDEVTAVLEEHPEASEAIYAAEIPPPTVTAAFTTDGATWEPVTLTSPLTETGQFAAIDDRLVTWWNEYDDDGRAEPTRAPVTTAVHVAWTDDLATWQTSTFEIDADDDAPAHVQHDVYVGNLAVVGDRWAAVLQRHRWVDPLALLPDDVQEELDAVESGYGFSTDDDGVTIEIDGGGGVERQRYTWAELGLDGNPEDDIGRGQPQLSLLSSTFGGEIVESSVPGGVQFANVFSAGDRFLLAGDDAFYESPDGVEWTGVADDVPLAHVETGVQLPVGTMLIGDDGDGPAAAVRDPDGGFRPVELPDLGRPYWLWNPSAQPVWIVELYDETEPSTIDFEPFSFSVEHDGDDVTIEIADDAITWTVTDLATGQVRGSGAFEPGDDVESGMEVVDPDTGETMVEFRDAAGELVASVPEQVLSAAAGDAGPSGDDTIVAEDAPAVTVAPMEAPERWLLATADGVEWLTLELPAASPESDYWPHSAAINGDRVLYPTPDGYALITIDG